MSDASPTAAPLHPPGPPNAPEHADAPSSRSAGLLSLLHRLFDYGKGVLLVLQQKPPFTPANVTEVTGRFSTISAQLIVARVMRGLQLALALKQRLEASAARLDRLPPTPRRSPGSPAGTAGPRACVQSPIRHGTPNDDIILMQRLPTAQEIAARVLHRPIGKVLADICVDLGILPRHPLWQELRAAIEEHGGSVRRVLLTAVRRLQKTTTEIAREAKRLALARVPPDDEPADTADGAAPAALATGPP